MGDKYDYKEFDEEKKMIKFSGKNIKTLPHVLIFNFCGV